MSVANLAVYLFDSMSAVPSCNVCDTPGSQHVNRFLAVPRHVCCMLCCQSSLQTVSRFLVASKTGSGLLRESGTEPCMCEPWCTKQDGSSTTAEPQNLHTQKTSLNESAVCVCLINGLVSSPNSKCQDKTLSCFSLIQGPAAVLAGQGW